MQWSTDLHLANYYWSGKKSETKKKKVLVYYEKCTKTLFKNSKWNIHYPKHVLHVKLHENQSHKSKVVVLNFFQKDFVWCSTIFDHKWYKCDFFSGPFNLFKSCPLLIHFFHVCACICVCVCVHSLEPVMLMVTSDGNNGVINKRRYCFQ